MATPAASAALRAIRAAGLTMNNADLSSLADAAGIQVSPPPQIAGAQLSAGAPCVGCSTGTVSNRRGNRLVVPLAQLSLVDTVRTVHAAPIVNFEARFANVAGLGITGRGRDSSGLPNDVRVFLIEESVAGAFVRLVSMKADARQNEPNIPTSGVPRALMTLDPQNFWNMGARYTGGVITTSFTAVYDVGAAATITLGMVSLSTDFLQNANDNCAIDVAE